MEVFLMHLDDTIAKGCRILYYYEFSSPNDGEHPY
jgi:hypothetical protein